MRKTRIGIIWRINACIIQLSLLSLSACRTETNNGIKINGLVDNIPAKKIYISNAYSWDDFIDSAVYSNGAFSFTLDTMKFKEPFLASLSFKDSDGKIESLPVINYIKTTVTDTFSSTGFMLQNGVTLLAQVFHLSGSLDAKEISPDCIGEIGKQKLLSCSKADRCLQSIKLPIVRPLIL